MVDVSSIGSLAETIPEERSSAVLFTVSAISSGEMVSDGDGDDDG
jgi:hypothetical protein